VDVLKRTNQSLQQSLARRAAEFDSNLQTACALASSLDMQAVWRAVSIGLGQMVTWDVCALLSIKPAHMFIQPREALAQELIEVVKSDLWETLKGQAEVSIVPEELPAEVGEPLAGKDLAAIHSSGVRVSINSPLVGDGSEVIGLLGLWRFSDEPFTGDGQCTLQTIAAEASIALARVRLFAELESRAREIETLTYVASSLNRSLDLQTILDDILQAALELVDGDSGSVMLLDPEIQKLRLYAARGLDDQIVERASRDIGQGIAWQVFQTRRPQLTQGALLGAALVEFVHPKRVTSSISMPLVLEDEVIGVLNINSTRPERLFTHVEMVALSNLAAQAAMAINQTRHHQALAASYDATLTAIAGALDLRDTETEGHTRRVTRYAITLAKILGINGDALVEIKRGALLHDIGKIGIPDEILRKPGSLNEVEWTVIRKHPTMGYNMLDGIKFLKGPAEIVLAHHERWDGRGYPRGLCSEAIPAGARIFAVVDAIDAITSNRPYRAARPFEVALEELIKMRGTQFDPAGVDVALEIAPAEWCLMKDRVEEERCEKQT